MHNTDLEGMLVGNRRVAELAGSGLDVVQGSKLQLEGSMALEPHSIEERAPDNKVPVLRSKAVVLGSKELDNKQGPGSTVEDSSCSFSCSQKYLLQQYCTRTTGQRLATVKVNDSSRGSP